jgi:hypothetical protein
VWARRPSPLEAIAREAVHFSVWNPDRAAKVHDMQLPGSLKFLEKRRTDREQLRRVFQRD